MSQREQDDHFWLIADKQDELALPFSCKTVTDYQHLPTEGAHAVVMSVIDTSVAIEEKVKALRQRAAYRLTPLFYIGELKENDQHWFDGPLDKAAPALANQIQQQLASLIPLEKSGLSGMSYYVLSWLFSRSHRTLTGQLEATKAAVLYYPLLAIYRSDEKLSDWEWIEDALHRRLITTNKLIDEIQVCMACQSGLLNFKNVCPNCNSIHVESKSFIHCFACGHMATLEESMRHERLVCGRCLAKLRHIGIDYDKPLEDKQCLSCHHVFLDASVFITCLVCKHGMPPESLLTHRLYDYSLTDRGKNLIQGIEHELYHYVGQFFNFIDKVTFEAIINWQTKLAKRHKSITFSLLMIQFVDTEALIAQHGLLPVEHKLEDLIKSLRQLLRQTDLASRTANTLYFLLPMTPAAQCDGIKARFKQFLHQQYPNKTIPLNVAIASIDAEEMIARDLKEELLMAELHNRMDDSE